MSEDDIQRQLGRIEGRLGAVENDVRGLEEDLKKALDKIDAKMSSMSTGIDGIATSIAVDKRAVQASWKTITVIASIVIAIASGGTWVYDKTHGMIEKLNLIQTQHIEQFKQVAPQTQLPAIPTTHTNGH